MRKVVITKKGGPEVLQIAEAADPTPAAGEVRVRVRAFGINFADILARKGLYPDAPPLPTTVGYEVSGVVDALGDGVDASWLGASVMALCHFGGYADTVVAPVERVFRKPDCLTFEQAAGVPVVYLTAWQLLVVMGGLRKNETVLIHNVGGGVGLAALDIARHIGAITIGTASPRKQEFLASKGLHHFVNYRENDWDEQVRKITNGKGVELIIDPVGGESWKKSYSLLRHTGRLGMYGASALSESSDHGAGFFTTTSRMLSFALNYQFYHPLKLLDNNRGVFGVNLGHMWHEADKVSEWTKEILSGFEASWLQPPIVDSVFDFDKVGDAHLRMERRENMGKVVIKIADAAATMVESTEETPSAPVATAAPSAETTESPAPAADSTV